MPMIVVSPYSVFWQLALASSAVRLIPVRNGPYDDEHLTHGGDQCLIVAFFGCDSFIECFELGIV